MMGLHVRGTIYNLVNRCIEKQEEPYEIKTDKITLIYKRGDKQDRTNYRPISNTSVLSKGLEKYVQKIQETIFFLNSRNHFF